MTVSIDQLMPRMRWDAELSEIVAIVEEVDDDVGSAADAAVPVTGGAVNVPLPWDVDEEEEVEDEFEFEAEAEASAPNPIFPLSKSNTVYTFFKKTSPTSQFAPLDA